MSGAQIVLSEIIGAGTQVFEIKKLIIGSSLLMAGCIKTI